MDPEKLAEFSKDQMVPAVAKKICSSDHECRNASGFDETPSA